MIIYPEWVTTEQQRRMHDDFRAFLWYIWKHLGLPPPTELQYDIAKYIQHGPDRLIVEAFRGCGKSWITAAYVLWCLYRDPQMKILVVSASKERADAFSIFVKRLIADVDILQFLQPKDNQRNSNISFDVGPATPDQSPSVRSAGITSQITGSRADLIIPDDVEVPNNSLTEDQREKLATRTSEFSAIMKPGARVVALGTPQNAQTLYLTLAKRGYAVRIWPARYTDGMVQEEGDEEPRDEYDGKLAPFILERLSADPSLMGTSVEPGRFTEEDLQKREADYGRSGFALQFMLNTALNDANRYPLKIRDLIVMDLDKKVAPVQLTWASGFQQVVEGIPNVGLNGDRCHAPLYVSDAHVAYQGAVMFIDPSGRGEDECAYAVTKMLNGLIFCTAWGGIRGNGYDESTLTALALTAKEHGVNEIFAESNFGDGMFNALFTPVLKRHYPCTLDEYKVTGQKELRIIQKMEPVLNQHRLVMDKAVVKSNSEADPGGSTARSGLHQMTHITKERGSLRHDDRIDILAEAVGHWTVHLDINTDSGEDKWRQQEKDKALAEFARIAARQMGLRKRPNYANLYR